MSRISLLKDLNDTTDRWHIVARVFRKWNVFHKAAPSDIFCVSMVLLDEEGDKIQASVLNKSLHDKFRHGIIEGQTYFFANFEVSPNVNQYRATTHPFKITLTPRTRVAGKLASLPSYSYSFFPLADIVKLDQSHVIDYLIDVLAFVKSMGTLQEYRRDNETKNKLRMVLTDIEGSDVECTLFDEAANDAFMSHLQNTQTPAVLLLNMARIGFSDDGKPQVCNSFNATRVFFNPPIKEVQQLIDSGKDNGSPALSFLSQTAPSQLSQQSCSGMARNQNKITISQIKDQPMGENFVINCIIQKLETRYDWVYDGCSKCGTKPRLENETSICPSCRKTPDSIEPKMKVHYTVKDHTGSTSVIFWDKLAVDLIKNTATELMQMLEKDPEEVDFPKNLDNPVGKNLLLIMKLNEYNKRHPGSSISVLQYQLCEDLMDQFTQASTEGSQVDNGEGEEHVKADETVPPTAQTEFVSDCNAKDDMKLSDLVNHAPHPPVKAKRRGNVKNNAVNHMDEASPAPQERRLKAIKIEK
ncbi:uncharacterized protein LOC114724812 [Neltuma alba]|uniref:uncharacterized protein LOC114712510 n=1 Tax=Neltuma alba TaxID=207710 RepID=UPI0010A56C88|nr:uncharacterized protein LOC114712510 [Prosopis alba]XP_028767100.1 uncharacterized protein LOC114724812 [Prosopis alba]